MNNPNNMKPDDELAPMISEVFQRRALLSDLDQLIISDVRRQARRAWIRQWARVVAFSFGLPLLLFVFFACAYFYIKEYHASTFIIVVMTLPAVALIYATHRAMENFSPEEV